MAELNISTWGIYCRWYNGEQTFQLRYEGRKYSRPYEERKIVV